MKVWEWIKKHLVLSLLLGIFGLFLAILFLDITKSFYGLSPQSLSLPRLEGGGINVNSMPQNYSYDSANRSGAVQSRLVTHEAELSLLVKNVKTTADAIVNYAGTVGGYMVNSSVSNPGESASGTVIIRVPADRLQATLGFLRQQSVQIVSESLTGDDITDQYKDIDTRLTTLNAMKKKFEAILEKATTVQDSLPIQQELFSLQDQIDQLIGQKQYLDDSIKYSKITVSLSTDELALPYASDQAWRPGVVFKEAIRSLVGTLRGLGSLAIWLGVYAVIWGPIVWLIYYKKKHKIQAKL